MNEKAMKVLEYNKIIELLKGQAGSEMTRKIISELKPFTDPRVIRTVLEETDEAVKLITYKGPLPLGNFYDIKSSVVFAQKGGTLNMKQLLQILYNMRITANVITWLKGDVPPLPILQSLVEVLAVFKDLAEEIDRSIESEDTVSDNASSELRTIRRSIVRQNETIKNRINQMINKADNQSMLQDAIVTVRDGRYVIPVKQEHRSKFPGIIHDQSASGATLFIEPQVIVNLNNELRELEVAEQVEIERILGELSSRVGEHAAQLNNNQEILVQLDLIMAKGKLAHLQHGECPSVNDEGVLRLKEARHPLIDRKKAVPINITIGDKYNTLVVTGPNTGGKTVTLKTAGLLSMMAQTGLHIPASSGSTIPIYENIFADIGDEQSIEQSLSTFSSHMTRIVSILDKVTEDSLVIFDELGAGTDPVEGAALAIAILEDVRMAGAKCIATTHYSELKNYALTKKSVENAAVEFDVETLSPTYRLLIGVPGKSNAFEISKKLGLSEFVINRAKEFINTENIELEDLLQNVEKNRIKAEEDRAEAEKLKTEIQMIRDAEAEKLEKLTNQKEKMMERARSEAFSITRQAKEEVDEIIKRLRELEQERASKEKNRQIEQLRKELTDSMGSLQPTVKSMIVPKVASKEIKNLKAGEDVKVITLNQEGTVVSADDKKKEAVVQIGIMKMTLPYKSLQRIKNQQQATVTKKTRSVIKAKSGRVKGEVDLRGMNLEEATLELEKYLDDATVAGLEQVTVIHGVGTGVLKTGLQDVLKKNKYVKKKRPGGYGEGGVGVTIVTLK